MLKNGGKGGTNHYKKETTKFRKFEIHGGVYWKTFKLTLSKTWSLQHFHQPPSSEKCLLCLLMSAKWSVPLSSRTVRNAWSREPEHWAKITFLRMLLWAKWTFLTITLVQTPKMCLSGVQSEVSVLKFSQGMAVIIFLILGKLQVTGIEHLSAITLRTIGLESLWRHHKVQNFNSW